MLRATSDPGAMNYAVFATPGNGVVVQWRTAQAGTTARSRSPACRPLYLRIVRSTKHLQRLHQPDNVTWTAVPARA